MLTLGKRVLTREQSECGLILKGGPRPEYKLYLLLMLFPMATEKNSKANLFFCKSVKLQLFCCCCCCCCLHCVSCRQLLLWVFEMEIKTKTKVCPVVFSLLQTINSLRDFCEYGVNGKLRVYLKKRERKQACSLMRDQIISILGFRA